jgi:isorenieratene synthase
MGASLEGCRVREGKLVCPWHGLTLGKAGHGPWKPFPVHDDGVLTWVRVGPEDPATPKPVLAPRPALFMEGVVRLEARCDPEDVIANRLDPWHGAHFHPYSFAALTVLGSDDDVLKVRVAKRLVGRLCAETDATFHSPEPRTIVMTIVEGEGKGSVVETHATPIEPGRTAVVEATLATSDRKGFRHAVKLGRLIRPFIERSARRLWVDDAAYAERLSERRGGSAPGRP